MSLVAGAERLTTRRGRNDALSIRNSQNVAGSGVGVERCLREYEGNLIRVGGIATPPNSELRVARHQSPGRISPEALAHSQGLVQSNTPSYRIYLVRHQILARRDLSFRGCLPPGQ